MAMCGVEIGTGLDCALCTGFAKRFPGHVKKAPSGIHLAGPRMGSGSGNPLWRFWKAVVHADILRSWKTMCAWYLLPDILLLAESQGAFRGFPSYLDNLLEKSLQSINLRTSAPEEPKPPRAHSAAARGWTDISLARKTPASRRKNDE